MAKKAASLRQQCLSAAAKPNKNIGWRTTTPKALLDELDIIIQEWVEGGELRDYYPTKTCLARWIHSLDNIDVSVATLQRHIKGAESTYYES